MHNGYDDVDDSELYENDHGDACECEECTYENAMFNCGMLPEHIGGGCSKAGSEECEFDCPFRNHDYETGE